MLAKLSRCEELESPLQCSQPCDLVMIFPYVEVLFMLFASNCNHASQYPLA
jgi:hypothetical protein